VSSKISRKKVKLRAPDVSANQPTVADPLYTEKQTAALLTLRNHNTLSCPSPKFCPPLKSTA